MQQSYLLGIDIGTGSTKALAMDYTGQSLGLAQRYYPVKSPQPGYSEQDPDVIFNAVLDCIAETVNSAGRSPAAISFSCAMHSLILVDENGNPLADMMTWADARSEAVATELRNSPEGAEIYHTSGTPVHAMSPLCKLIWLRQNNNVLFTAAHKFISIKEYIWHRLFNAYQADYAVASSTGLFDILKLEWNAKACALAGISTTQLSQPVNTTYRRAGLNHQYASLLKLDESTAFVIGASDGCCANLGSFVTGPGIASLTIGTSGAVRITSPAPVYNFGAMIFNYLLNQNTFVCGGAINNGGIALNWLFKNFAGKNISTHHDYEALFDEIADVPAGSDGLIFLPYLYGERAPLWDTKTCGTFFNIKPGHTQAHFLRAGLEGICFTLNDVIKSVELSSSPITQLNISGGFISSKIWTQMLADITGKKLTIVQDEDASALGAIFLAMEALDIPIPVQPHHDEMMDIFPGATNHQVYNKSFTIFKKLYSVLKDTMHEMNDVHD